MADFVYRRLVCRVLRRNILWPGPGLCLGTPNNVAQVQDSRHHLVHHQDDFHSFSLELELDEKLQRAALVRCPKTPELIHFVNNNLVNDDRPEVSSLLLRLSFITSHACEECAQYQYSVQDWSLRICAAAISEIDRTFKSQRQGELVSYWISSIEVFTAATALLDAHSQLMRNGSSQIPPHCGRAVLRASTLLAAFSEIWQDACAFRDTIDQLSEQVFADFTLS